MLGRIADSIAVLFLKKNIINEDVSSISRI